MTHYKPRTRHQTNIWEYIAYGTLIAGAGLALYFQGKFKPQPDVNINVTIQSRKSPSVEKLVEIPAYEPTNGVFVGYPYSNNGKDSLPIATANSNKPLEGKLQ